MSEKANTPMSAPSCKEVSLMAEVLINRAGEKAPDLALFFAEEHRQLGDHVREKAWRKVAKTLQGAHKTGSCRCPNAQPGGMCPNKAD